MKKKVKANQLVIACLTVALGVAGYINFSSNTLKLSEDEKSSEAANEVISNHVDENQSSIDEADMAYDENIVLDSDNIYDEKLFADEDTSGEAAQDAAAYDEISDGEGVDEASATDVIDISSEEDASDDIILNSDEEDIGEAVLTSADVTSDSLVMARLNREQVRSKSKEFYLEVMNGTNMDSISVEDATKAYMSLVSDMEKEADCEVILAAKGLSNVVVSISEGSVDVCVSESELTDELRAQIEEIVMRKCGCSIEQININCLN